MTFLRLQTSAFSNQRGFTVYFLWCIKRNKKVLRYKTAALFS